MKKKTLLLIVCLAFVVITGIIIHLSRLSEYGNDLASAKKIIVKQENISAKLDGRDIVIVDTLDIDDFRLIAFAADNYETYWSLGYAVFHADKKGNYSIQTGYIREGNGIAQSKMLVEHLDIKHKLYDVVIFNIPDIKTVQRTLLGTEGADQTVYATVSDDHKIVLIESPISNEVSAYYCLYDANGTKYE